MGTRSLLGDSAEHFLFLKKELEEEVILVSSYTLQCLDTALNFNSQYVVTKGAMLKEEFDTENEKVEKTWFD